MKLLERPEGYDLAAQRRGALERVQAAIVELETMMQGIPAENAAHFVMRGTLSALKKTKARLGGDERSS